MICDAPAKHLEPPSWRLPAPENGAESFSIGFVAFGSIEDVTKLAVAARKAGFYCGLPDADGGVEIMVFFDRKSTKEGAFDLYKRVERGEFGKFSKVGLMIAPVSALTK